MSEHLDNETGHASSGVAAATGPQPFESSPPLAEPGQMGRDVDAAIIETTDGTPTEVISVAADTSDTFEQPQAPHADQDEFEQPAAFETTYVAPTYAVDRRPSFTMPTLVLAISMFALFLAILLAMIVGRNLLPNSDTLFPGAAPAVSTTQEPNS